METLLPFFFFTTGMAGLGVSIVLLTSQKSFQNFYLSLCVFSLAICTLYNFCYTEGLLPQLPFLFIIAKSFIFLVAPTGYLYVRNVFRAEKAYQPFDWIHFIPFVLVILYLTNMSLVDPSAIQRALADSSVNWFVEVSHIDLYYDVTIFKLLLWVFYTVLSSRCIINFERGDGINLSHLNYRLLKWVKIFNITLIVLFSSLFIQRFVDISFISLDFINDTTMSVILLITIFFLILNPHILYSLQPAALNLYTDAKLLSNRVSTDCADKPLTVKSLFNDKKKDEYLLMLDDVLTNDKPYLNKGITIKDLADQTKIPAHHLSCLISTEFNLHFQDFINLRRIEYLKNHMEETGWKQLTLEGICWEIGFTSRTTFFRAFIKFTGLSPSEYFNSVKKNNHSA